VQEYEFVKQKVLDIQSPKSVLSIANSMRVSRYKDPKVLNQSCFVYKMLTGFDLDSVPNIHTLYEVSELLQVLAFFG